MKPVFSLSLSRLQKSFHGGNLVLDDIALELNAGEAVLLSGKNGSGKTTLLRILAGLEKPDQGIVDFGYGPTTWKKSRKALLKNAMYLHQQPYMFSGSTRKNLHYAVSKSLDKKRADNQVEQALQWATLEDQAEQDAKTLSGGQQQRVALARAWLRRCPVLLLDEPITNMDVDSSLRTIRLLEQLKAAGSAILVSSHVHQAFEGLIDRHLELKDRTLHPAGQVEYSDNITPISRKSQIESGNG